VNDDVRSGRALDGFTLGERLPGGAMSCVFRVTQPGLERPLVMKLPKLGPTQNESVIAFETEVSILPSLTGPHVATFVAAGDLARTPYLVTEWIEGRTVEALLEGPPLPPDDLARLGAALADALHSVHQQDVVHLDLKPGNAIVRPDGTCVLIDFGFAHHARVPDLLAEETRYKAGSAPYVSPEQLLGARDDRRSDLFALGVVLYELATGKLPFGEPDSDVRNRFWLDPVPPAVLAPQVPPWLQEIILRCLETEAERRYQSAAHVAFDLRHPEQVALTARATKAARAGLWAHARRFLQARAQVGPRLRAPAALLSRTPIVLVAVDTAHLDDERHPAIRYVLSQLLAQSREFRLLGLTVIPPGAGTVEHLVRLRHWVAPLSLPAARVSLHAVESESPAEVILALVRHNSADLVVIGAPPEGGRAWAQSVASFVTAGAPCSVHVVRAAKR